MSENFGTSLESDLDRTKRRRHELERAVEQTIEFHRICHEIREKKNWQRGANCILDRRIRITVPGPNYIHLKITQLCHWEDQSDAHAGSKLLLM